MAVPPVLSTKPVRVFVIVSSMLCLFVFWSAILSSMWTFESELVKDGGESVEQTDQVCHVLVISTYPPRRCGIGVFADNFIKAMRTMGSEFARRIGANRHCEYSVIAFDDPDSSNIYNASTVLGIINLDADVPSRAFWNASQYVVEHQKRTVKNLKSKDVLGIPKKDLPFTHMVLQLEFGLIKIKWQALDLVRWMTGALDSIEGMPHLHTSIVVHSPYAYPNLEEKGFVRHMSYFADAFVVMSWHAYHSMVSAYGVETSKVFFIPHAVRKPKELLEVPRNIDGVQLADARQGGLSLDQLDNLLALPQDDPRRPLLIFNNGLIHVHKGYNRVIRNLRRIIDAVPEHPIVVLITGREARTNEEKDIMKKHLQYAAELGVAQHIIWQDEYVESEEVDRRLYGSDVYMTPYDEITPTSGALLEAMAHGCAILSTAYRHATEVLSSDRGMLVPFEDDDAITEGFVNLLKSRETREEYGKRAKAFVKNWTWERVALQYHALLAKLEANAVTLRGGVPQLQTPGAAYVEELLLPVTPDPFYLDPAFDAHLYPPLDRDDSELATITPENNKVNSFRPSSAHWSEKLVTTFNGLTLFNEEKLKSYEGGLLPKDLRMAPGVYVLFADKDLQVNAKIAARSETGYLLSRVGIRWRYTWILADVTMGLDLETFDPDLDNRVDLSEFIHIDRLEPEPVKEGSGWRERMVLRAPQVWVTVIVHMNKEVTVTLSQPDRFSHPLGLLGQTIRCHWDLPSITGECPQLFFDDIKSLKPDQWRMSLLEGNNIFSTASKGQTWQMFGIRLNAFELDEEMMTGTLFDYYDTSPTNTVMKFRLEGPVLDNCGFAMVNRQLWFGLSIRQQLRHNWRSALPNPFGKDFEIEVQVIPTEDTVSVEQYEKAASPGSVLHMLVYTAYKKQLQQPPDQVNSPVVSVFRNHWPPKFQYPNESLPAEVAAGTKIVWIHQQPWEFYGIPLSWTTWLINAVDALWVPSRHCEVGYIANSIPAKKINVVRHGVSFQKVQVVTPGMASGGSLALPEMAKPLQSKTFKFLFIGGALPRKGIDLLLRAFVETFSTHDDVSLIVHSIYGDEFKTHVMEALETQYDKYPEIVFLKQELTWVDMVLLYRSVDIYVCPYRNEGFGLTIVEAMANGLPIIITKGGPAAEICEDDHTYWVDADWTRCRDVKPCEANGTKIFGEELAVPAAWFEPSLGSLSAAMRNAYRMPIPKLHRMGEAARRRASELTWEPVYTEMESVLSRYTVVDEPQSLNVIT